MVLPIFILLLISLIYVRDQVLGQQAAQEQARSCAWLYSWNNCQFDAQLMPAECRELVSEAPTLSKVSEEVTEKLVGDGFFSDIVMALIEPGLEAAFGRSLDAKATREVARPLIYGGKTKTMQGEYHLACNLAKTTAPEVAVDAWSRVSPF